MSAHFGDHGCAGQLGRAGLDALCPTCLERFAGAFRPTLDRLVVPAPRLSADERGVVNAYALHVRATRPAAFPAETPLPVGGLP